MVPVVAVWNHTEFRDGDRVRVTNHPHVGTFKPSETGYLVEIEPGSHHTGIVVRGEKPYVQQSAYEISIEIEYGIEIPLRRDLTSPNVVVVVRWDEQVWKVYRSAKIVKLSPFEAEIHACYLEKIDDPSLRIS